MKKKIIISALVLLIIGLFVPIHKTYDDGTESYSALAYKIVKWNRPFYKNLVYSEREVYYFPISLESVEKLWSGMIIDPAFSLLTGIIHHTEDNRILVETVSDTGFFKPGQTVDITDYISDSYSEGEIIEIEYFPSANPSEANIDRIVDIYRAKKRQ